jgi:hypothetical protein
VSPVADRSRTIEFCYLDARQGAAIEMYHTGASPDAVTVTGTVMGIPAGIKRVTSGASVVIPAGLPAGSLVITVPTRQVPRSLRVAVGDGDEVPLAQIILRGLMRVWRERPRGQGGYG